MDYLTDTDSVMNEEAKRNFSNELEGVKRFGMVLVNLIEIIMQPQQKERFGMRSILSILALSFRPVGLTFAPLMVAALLSVAFAAPVIAHHSFAAEFDGDKPVTLRGMVTKVEWRNPHIWVYLDVKGADGKITPWQCEGGAPNALTRQGWSRDTLKLGEEIIIEGYKAKNGSNTCNSRTWKLSNGKTVFAGNAQ